MDWLCGDRRPLHRTGRTAAHQRRAALPALRHRSAAPLRIRSAAKRARSCRRHRDGCGPVAPDARHAQRRTSCCPLHCNPDMPTPPPSLKQRHYTRQEDSDIGVSRPSSTGRLPRSAAGFAAHRLPIWSASTTTGHNSCWGWTLTRSPRCAAPAPCCTTRCRSWRQPHTGHATTTAKTTHQDPDRPLHPRKTPDPTRLTPSPASDHPRGRRRHARGQTSP